MSRRVVHIVGDTPPGVIIHKARMGDVDVRVLNREVFDRAVRAASASPSKLEEPRSPWRGLRDRLTRR